jgi:hypothetical protein
MFQSSTIIGMVVCNRIRIGFFITVAILLFLSTHYYDAAGEIEKLKEFPGAPAIVTLFKRISDGCVMVRPGPAVPAWEGRLHQLAAQMDERQRVGKGQRAAGDRRAKGADRHAGDGSGVDVFGHQGAGRTATVECSASVLSRAAISTPRTSLASLIVRVTSVCCGRLRFDHLRRIDDAVELLFRNDTSAWNERAVFSLVERRRRAARRPSVVVLEV